MKVNELTGAALDWAVATCEGLDYWEPEIGPSQPEYSTDWAQGGPIIERERIDLRFDDEWIALMYGIDYDAEGMPDEYPCGPTPLIAAMRCYVASQFGDEVDVPEELL